MIVHIMLTCPDLYFRNKKKNLYYWNKSFADVPNLWKTINRYMYTYGIPVINNSWKKVWRISLHVIMSTFTKLTPFKFKGSPS